MSIGLCHNYFIGLLGRFKGVLFKYLCLVMSVCEVNVFSCIKEENHVTSDNHFYCIVIFDHYTCICSDPQTILFHTTDGHFFMF